MKMIIINNKDTDYEIDENGKIYSNKTNKFLTGSIFNTGYKMVRLTINGQKKAYAIHRLVAEAFLSNPDNLPVVNHIDGNKLNNNVTNLEWVTQSENRLHAIKNNISNLAKGTREKIFNIEKEKWLQYQNTNYFVSIDGSIYNTKTNILLKKTPNQSGYIRYTLRIDGKNVSKLAHILVIETWGSIKILKNQVVNHKDGNKQNNNISNLEVVSKSENAIHSYSTLKNNVKPVIRIDNEKNEQKEYYSVNEAARQMKVSDGAIRYALKNKTKCCNYYWIYK